MKSSQKNNITINNQPQGGAMSALSSMKPSSNNKSTKPDNLVATSNSLVTKNNISGLAGGLVQIVTSGKQDIYLTINPEITFFKKVFKKHTNFSLELIEINPEQLPEYNNISSFIIKNGDAIHRCYLEVELPNLIFSDKYVENTNYTNRKNTEISNLNTKITKWDNDYNNLKNYVDIETILYRTLYQFLQTTNITLNTLKTQVTNFNYKYKSQKDNYKNKIEQSIYLQIDISGYINSITKLITNETTFNDSIYISRLEILDTINNMYNIMVESLNYYFRKRTKFSKELSNKNNEYQINFNYSEYLGHNYFDYFQIDFGGQQLQKYSNDVLHINQMHNIKSDYMDNYLEMIGHTQDLNEFNNLSKGNKKIIVPLIFWFNKNAGSSLPIVALQYSTLIVNTKIADIKKIYCFENYEKMYDDLLKVSIDVINDKYEKNTKLLYTNNTYDIINKTINYDCLYINDELLKNVYPDLSLEKRNIILENNGTLYTSSQLSNLVNNNITYEQQYIINKNQWIGFMLNIKDPLYSTIAPIVGSYYPYIDFNLYYSLIQNPSVKLICEYVYFDDLERARFADSNLEYIIETFNEDIFNIKEQPVYDCELSFYGPCKELTWYVQPQIYKDGFTENGQNTGLLFDYSKYFTNNIISSQTMTFNQLDVLLSNVDDNYYNYALSYKYLNNILPTGIYYHSFCLYPEESQPSGTINLREVKGKQYKIKFNKNFLAEYKSLLNELYGDTLMAQNKMNLYLKFIAKSYDVLNINKGTYKLIFNI